jgi:hypothetical protein
MHSGQLFFLLQGMVTERTPGNPATRNRAACWRLFDETCKILADSAQGFIPRMVPMHPNDIFTK